MIIKTHKLIITKNYKTMNLRKKDLLLILNIYQNYINDFVNITDKDLNNIYLQIAKKDLKQLLTKNN